MAYADAVVGIANAVLERGGVLVAPANPDLIMLLAQASYPHARAHLAERERGGEAPLEVHETGGYSPQTRRLLEPFAHRNALAYFDDEGRALSLREFSEQGDWAAVALDDIPRHPFSPSIIDGAVGVIVIFPDDEMAGELAALRRSDAPNVTVIGGRFASPDDAFWARENDGVLIATRRLDDPALADGPIAYGLVGEWMLDTWLENS